MVLQCGTELLPSWGLGWGHRNVMEEGLGVLQGGARGGGERKAVALTTTYSFGCLELLLLEVAIGKVLFQACPGEVHTPWLLLVAVSEPIEPTHGTNSFA